MKYTIKARIELRNQKLSDILNQNSNWSIIQDKLMFNFSQLPGEAIQVDTNINKLNDLELMELTKLATQYTAVVLRRQNISSKQAVKIAKLMGRTIRQRYFFCHPEHTEIGLVTNKRDSNNNKIGIFADHEIGWHSNGNTRKTPLEDMIMLYCIKKGLGSNTYFANTRLAYNELSDKHKSIANNIACELSFDLKRDDQFYKLDKDDPEYQLFSGKILKEKGLSNDYGPVEKPLICMHPLTKQKALYFPYQIINSWRHIQEDKIPNYFKEFLICHTFRKKFIYEHKWESGDILFNDQWNTLHRRDKVSSTEERLLYRVPFGLDKLSY